MRLALLRLVLPFLLVLGGCEPAWQARFPTGTKLYEKTGHRYFGKVVGFESQHDFHNGTPAQPAIQIEQDDAAHTTVWGACSTCAASFDIEAP